MNTTSTSWHTYSNDDRYVRTALGGGGAAIGGGKGALIGGLLGAGGGFLGERYTKGEEATVKSGTEFGVKQSPSGRMISRTMRE